jgi:RNA polymerase sigma-70 factor, ECF subfamily
MTTSDKARTIPELAADDPCVAGCRAGRSESIETLFRTYGGMVQGVIGRLVGPTPDFEDLVQTTFAEALSNLGRFRGEAKLSTWLCGIAVHVAHHHLRAGKVRRHVPLELVAQDRENERASDRAMSLPALIAPSVADQTIDGRRLASKLHAVCDRISPKKRIALLLYVMEDRSVEEIAALMRATQTATRSRMYFARRELRKLIRADAELRELADGLLGETPEESENSEGEA